MGYQLTKLSPSRRYGVMICGLQEHDLSDESTRTRLRDIWVEHGLIVFRGSVSPQFHIALSRVFGDLEAHPLTSMQVEGQPELIQLRYDPDGEILWDVDGRQLGAWLPWHSDLVYVERINHGGVLRALSLPRHGGGQTGFIDQIESYDRLPEDLKHQIEGLDIVYRLRVDFGRHPYLSHNQIRLVRLSPSWAATQQREETDFPLVAHPIVYRQPETGRKVLNISPMCAEYIDGMDNPAGDALLRRLVAHVTDDCLAYHHEWTINDLVLWDNWRMLHNCSGIGPDDSRTMYRTTIAGDYALGRKIACRSDSPPSAR